MGIRYPQVMIRQLSSRDHGNPGLKNQEEKLELLDACEIKRHHPWEVYIALKKYSP